MWVYLGVVMDKYLRTLLAWVSEDGSILSFPFFSFGYCRNGNGFVDLSCREQLSPILKHTNMKSRITIEVNFDEGNLPVIQILSNDSDDVRDKLLKSFIQSLHHTSRWCKIIYMGNMSTYPKPNELYTETHKWHIVPIKPNEISEEIKLMKATLEEWERPIDNTKAQTV